MQLFQVKVDGYKRLRDVSTFVNGRLVAFVGPNEAGKSSFLEALRLMETSDAVPSNRRSRTDPPITGRHAIVETSFRLSDHDLRLLEHCELEVVPKILTLSRLADGAKTYLFKPEPKRTNVRREAAREALESLGALAIVARLFLDKEPEAPEQPDLQRTSHLIESAIAFLDETGDDDIHAFDWPDFHNAIAVLEDSKSVGVAVKAINQFIEQSETTVGRACYNALALEIPHFLLFDQESRDLHSEYGLRDPDIVAVRPVALDRLLTLAGTNYQALVDCLDEPSRRETLLARANQRLAEIFSARWQQSNLTVRLNTSAATLEVAIREPDSNSVSALDERSDGLRTFVALTAFIGTGSKVPPILLIDEAETHLHYNAQADLINMLTTQRIAGQVLYTTHSPGCLPRDLGRGVRFVEPDSASETSTIRHDFWDYEGPKSSAGFSPLLFVMGAGAAAFASLRHAVICEGPTEMLLLPSIIRAAIGVDELPYQVAPGIATLASGGFPALGTIAAHSCYLVDGDKGGLNLKKELRAKDVPNSKILSLQEDWAVEDLIEPSQYLKAVSDLVGGGASGLQTDPDIFSKRPIKKAVKDWCSARDLRCPGAISVAEHLLGSGEEIVVNPEAKPFLAGLDRDFRRVLGLGE